MHFQQSIPLPSSCTPRRKHPPCFRPVHIPDPFTSHDPFTSRPQVRTSAQAGDSTVARLGALMETAAAQRSSRDRAVEVFARWYTPGVVLAAVMLALVPSLVHVSHGSSWPLLAMFLNGEIWVPASCHRRGPCLPYPSSTITTRQNVMDVSTFQHAWLT